VSQQNRLTCFFVSFFRATEIKVPKSILLMIKIS